jgi:hypothetical protein
MSLKTEGCIKSINVECGSPVKVKFTIEPSSQYLFEEDGKKGILFQDDNKKDFKREDENISFTVPNQLFVIWLTTIKTNRNKVRVVCDSSYSTESIEVL